MYRVEATPSAGGASTAPVPEAVPEGVDPLLVGEAVGEKGEAVEKAVGADEPERVPLMVEAPSDCVAIEVVVSVGDAEADTRDEASLAVAGLDVEAAGLDDEEASGKMVWILISWHCAPIHSSYRLPNSPLMHLHQRVEPPIASEPLLQTEKPPV